MPRDQIYTKIESPPTSLRHSGLGLKFRPLSARMRVQVTPPMISPNSGLNLRFPRHGSNSWRIWTVHGMGAANIGIRRESLPGTRPLPALRFPCGSSRPAGIGSMHRNRAGGWLAQFKIYTAQPVESESGFLASFCRKTIERKLVSWDLGAHFTSCYFIR
jgi:hypothetical protein